MGHLGHLESAPTKMIQREADGQNPFPGFLRISWSSENKTKHKSHKITRRESPDATSPRLPIKGRAGGLLAFLICNINTRLAL